MDINLVSDIIFYLMVTCWSVGGFAILMLILGEFIDCSEHKINPKFSKIAFCRKAVEWCVAELGLPKSKIKPHVKLTYKKKGPHLGCYHAHQKLILVHFNNSYHHTLKDICNTIVHEYVHHLQITTNNISYEYDKETATVGYWKNKYEREAREVAKQKERQLFDYMLEQKFIVKQKTNG
jgi:hypothetical protein